MPSSVRGLSKPWNCACENSAARPIAWRSTWEVEQEIASGQLVEVLAEFAAPANGIYAVFPQRKHLPLRVRLWIDFLKHHYARPEFWKTA